MEMKHSELGITSVIINIAVIISISIMVWLYQTAANYVNNLPLPIGLNSLCMIASPIFLLAALGLGIGGLTQKNRKKDFSILGTIISAFLIVVLVVIYILLSQS